MCHGHYHLEGNQSSILSTALTGGSHLLSISFPSQICPPTQSNNKCTFSVKWASEKSTHCYCEKRTLLSSFSGTVLGIFSLVIFRYTSRNGGGGTHMHLICGYMGHLFISRVTGNLKFLHLQNQASSCLRTVGLLNILLATSTSQITQLTPQWHHLPFFLAFTACYFSVA